LPARASRSTAQGDYRQQQAELQSAVDSTGYAEREYQRKKALVANDFTPREVYDQTETTLKAARQKRRLDRTADRQHGGCAERRSGYRGPIAIQRSRRQGPARPGPARSVLCVGDGTRRWRRDQGRRPPGRQFRQSGTAVFSLLSSRRIWIEANFRETA